MSGAPVDSGHMRSKIMDGVYAYGGHCEDCGQAVMSRFTGGDPKRCSACKRARTMRVKQVNHLPQADRFSALMRLDPSLLDSQEREIVERRARRRESLSVVARDLMVSPERVRQIEAGLVELVVEDKG